MNTDFIRPAIAIVLTACGIETRKILIRPECVIIIAIVLTACGIETFLYITSQVYNPMWKLQ